MRTNPISNTYYGGAKHTKDGCFKLVGYPFGGLSTNKKGKNNTINKGPSQNKEHKANMLVSEEEAIL